MENNVKFTQIFVSFPIHIHLFSIPYSFKTLMRTALTTIKKGCAILSILANSANARCNAFQAVQGFFLKSVNTPKCVINVLAHGGWSISLMSICNMVKSLMKEQQTLLKGLSSTRLFSIAYDNLDFDFKAKEPTIEHQGSFESIMTATFIPLTHGATQDDLHFSQKIWEESPTNPDSVEDSRPCPPPHTNYIFSHLRESAPCIHSAIEWFIKYKLVEEYSHKFHKQLGYIVPI